MCDQGCGGFNAKEPSKFYRYFKALHCPTRWVIIRLIGDGTKSTKEIFEGMKKVGKNLSKSGLYYHLSEMEQAGIIELAKYLEVRGGAPEKVWKLKTKEMKINLLTDLPEVPNHEQ
jgi:DNA-binding transcriptional ArsR family regulator